MFKKIIACVCSAMMAIAFVPAAAFAADIPATAVEWDMLDAAESLDVDDECSLDVTITPSNSTDTITYTTSDSSVVSVQYEEDWEAWTMKAVSAGTATVKATATSGAFASCLVTVGGTDDGDDDGDDEPVSATGIELDADELELDLAEENIAYLEATLTPSNATDTITWSSSNSKVATVEDWGDGEAEIDAVAVGSCTVTATAGSVSASCEVTVVQGSLAVGPIFDDSNGDWTAAIPLGESLCIAPYVQDRLTWTDDDGNPVKCHFDYVLDEDTVDWIGDLITVDKHTGVVSYNKRYDEDEECGIGADIQVYVSAGDPVADSAATEPCDEDGEWVSDIEFSINPETLEIDYWCDYGAQHGKKYNIATKTYTDGLSLEATTPEVSKCYQEGSSCALNYLPDVSANSTMTFTYKQSEGLAAFAENYKALGYTSAEAAYQAIEGKYIYLTDPDNKSVSMADGDAIKVTKVNSSAGTVTLSVTTPETFGKCDLFISGGLFSFTGSDAATKSNKLYMPLHFLFNTTETLVPSTGIELSADTLEMSAGGEDQLLVATLTPSDSTDTITWESSNPAVATVSDAGVVSAVAPGTATIKATAKSGVNAKCTVTVSQAATSVTLNTNSLALYKGDTAELTATVSPESTTAGVVWASSDSAVATVDTNGNVVATGRGTATITATADSVSAQCVVTVNETQTISVAAASYAKTFGAADFNLNAQASTALTYKTSNAKVATVTAAGKVHIVGAGTAIITIDAAAADYYDAASATVKVTVAKAKQTAVKIVTAAKVVKGCKKGKLKAKRTFLLSKSGVKGAAKVTWKKISGNVKIAVATNGRVTVKKGIKKGAYKVKVRLTVAATANYLAKTINKVITVRVK